jgi:hypothetical protein
LRSEVVVGSEGAIWTLEISTINLIITDCRRKSCGGYDFAVVMRNLLLCLDVAVGCAVAVAGRR